MAMGGTNFSEKGLRDEQIMQAFGCVDGVDGSELLVTRGLFIALGWDGNRKDDSLPLPPPTGQNTLRLK